MDGRRQFVRLGVKAEVIHEWYTQLSCLSILGTTSHGININDNSS